VALSQNAIQFDDAVSNRRKVIYKLLPHFYPLRALACKNEDKRLLFGRYLGRSLSFKAFQTSSDGKGSVFELDPLVS